jgi:ribokinase
MAIWNFGSINADLFYAVPHLPAPGETIIASEVWQGLGGKGANQSVAAARAGSTVHHIGAIGADGRWARDRLAELGVDVAHVAEIDGPSGHAIISVAANGENAIVVFGGANTAQSPSHVAAALSEAAPGDIVLTQNETPHLAELGETCRRLGLRLVYSAAPFSVKAVREILPYASIIAMNAVEARQLSEAVGDDLSGWPVEALLITKGADGAEWRDLATGETVAVPAFPVTPVDTTGAGDTFTGFFAAALDQGLAVRPALERAAGAAALKVTRKGTADAIPSLADVTAFLDARS